MNETSTKNQYPAMKPKALMCYICGREYGTKSLEIHLKSCQEKFLMEESKKPKNQRRPLPQPPKPMGGGGTYDTDSYNDQAFNVYKEQSLEKCNFCGRTFNRESFPTHQKICKPDKPFKPLPGFVQDPQKVQQQLNHQDNASSGYKMTSQPKIPSRPKTLMCYICGREYGTKSLAIHIPQCKEMFFVQELKKPKQERRKPPTTPKGLMELLSRDEISLEDIIAYNNGAFNKYNKEALEMCKNCGRTFKPEALAHHIKACTEEKPFNKLEEGDQESQLVPCKKCGRKFIASRVQKHENACKDIKMNSTTTGFTNQKKPNAETESQQMNSPEPANTNSMYKKTFQVPKQEFKEQVQASPPELKQQQQQQQQSKQQQQQQQKSQHTSSADEIKCYKCLINQITVAQLLQHVQNCKGTGNKPEIYEDLVQIKNPSKYLLEMYSQQLDKEVESKKTQTAQITKAEVKTNNQSQPQSKTFQPQEELDDSGNDQDEDLIECTKCGRHFAQDRISKHQKVCKGKKYFEKKEHKVQIQKAPETGWRKYHEEFLETIKYNRKLKQIQESGGDIRQLGPPPASSNDNYVQCPYCKRKFDPAKADKHINICQNVVNKPKSVKEKQIQQKSQDQQYQQKQQLVTPNKSNQLLTPQPAQFKIRSSPSSSSRSGAKEMKQSQNDNIFKQGKTTEQFRKSNQQLLPIKKRS